MAVYAFGSKVKNIVVYDNLMMHIFHQIMTMIAGHSQILPI